MANSAKEVKAALRSRRNLTTNAGLIEIQIQYRAVGDLALDPRNLTGRDAVRASDGKLFRELEAEKEQEDER